MTPLTRRDRRVIAGVVLVVAFLALQPAFVPRMPERQVEFAWEMYSKSGPLDEFVLVYEDREILTSPSKIQPLAPATIDYLAVMPPFLCRTNSELLSVRLFRGGGLIGVFECSR